MISQLEKEITFRFLKARKKDGFLNIISIFSFIGISLGVAVLIIVMSVMNGFRTELINKIVGFNPHITVKPYESKYINPARFNSPELNSISKNLISSNTSEAIVINSNNSKGIILRGYESNDFSKLSIINNKNFLGNKINLKKNNISIGKELSFDLNLKLGDKIMIMSPMGVQTIIGSLPKQQAFIINSIYDSGLAEFDQNIAFVNINTLENFFNLNVDDRNLEIYLKNPTNIEKVKIIIQEIFDNEYVYTWSDLNSSLFSALKVERNVMFIILSLIIIVAAFNIISGLTILIKNKTKEIAILKALGLSKQSIIKSFFLTGFLIGLIATITGVLLGIIFSIYIEEIRQFLSSVFNLQIFPEDVYFLNEMPSEISPESILSISIFSILVTILASLFPSLAVTKIEPIKALKYE